MHVRIKITLIFSLIMGFLLSLFCGFIYYFFYAARIDNIKAHLTNHALTIARMLDQPRVFNQSLIKKIDSITVIPMKSKTVQVYNSHNERIYFYSDLPNDTLHITGDILNETRANHIYFFTAGNREAVTYYDDKSDDPQIILVASFDEEGKRNLDHLKIILLISFICGSSLLSS